MSVTPARILKRKAQLCNFRKEHRLCTRCGDALTADNSFFTCPPCRKRARTTKPRVLRRRAAARSFGMCPYHPEREGVEGATLCGVCAEAHGDYNKAYRERMRAKNLALEHPKCSTCFKRTPEPGKLGCASCLKKGNDRHDRAKKRQELKTQGFALVRRSRGKCA